MDDRIRKADLPPNRVSVSIESPSNETVISAETFGVP